MKKLKLNPPKRLENRYGFLLYSVHKALETNANIALQPVGISTRHLGVLDTLLSFDSPLSQKELCKQTQRDRTSMGAIVGELEKMMLVIRDVDPKDNRAYSVKLTEEGIKKTILAARLAKKNQKSFLNKISESDRKKLLQILRDLYSTHEIKVDL